MQVPAALPRKSFSALPRLRPESATSFGVSGGRPGLVGARHGNVVSALMTLPNDRMADAGPDHLSLWSGPTVRVLRARVPLQPPLLLALRQQRG